MIVFLAALGFVSLGTSVAGAETTGDFITRLQSAYAAPDKPAALKAMYYLGGMDAETVQMYEDRIIARFLVKYEAPTVALEPLPDDFEALQVGGGWEIRPNLKPLGYVALNGKTRILYGRKDERYYLVGIIRTPVTDPAGPEVMLQMIVLSFGNPRVQFDGHCDVLLANRDIKRVRLNDEGQASKTMLVTGVRIEKCELNNLSAQGGVMLRLLEGEDQIFDRQVDYPESGIAFNR